MRSWGSQRERRRSLQRSAPSSAHSITCAGATSRRMDTCSSSSILSACGRSGGRSRACSSASPASAVRQGSRCPSARRSYGGGLNCLSGDADRRSLRLDLKERLEAGVAPKAATLLRVDLPHEPEGLSGIAEWLVLRDLEQKRLGLRGRIDLTP